jgi:hypothetical protein
MSPRVLTVPSASLLVSALVLALAPATVSAQSGRATTTTRTTTTAAPAAAASTPDYAARIGQGSSAIGAGDRPGAIVAFREAVQLEPSRPEGVCYLAAAQRLSGDMNAALDGFQACARVARAAGDGRWTGRALHGIASTLERMPERAADARAAWQEYVRFADSATAHAIPQVGRARITAIDQVVELERAMVEVRQRIAEREAQRAAPPPASR